MYRKDIMYLFISVYVKEKVNERHHAVISISLYSTSNCIKAKNLLEIIQEDNTG